MGLLLGNLHDLFGELEPPGTADGGTPGTAADEGASDAAGDGGGTPLQESRT